MSEIVTFYSYKGGTGRTMALANVAWILAAAGHRVLMVDWDLEAPGLHRYFHPFLHDKELVSSTGIIDIVIDFAIQATTPAATERDDSETWHLPYADVLRHAVSINWDFGKGQLDLLPAGQQSASYAARVNSFNWDNFYERLGGGTFLNALRASMLKEYQYVLIDSRTGVSDTSGICTVQMPDKVVVCFTLNRQSIEGVASIVRSVVDGRARSRRPEAKIFPVPTRVEKAETVRLEAARDAARARFAPLLGHLPEASRARYWDDIEVAYQPYYAYEEVLATFGDGSPLVGSLLHSMENLAARMIEKPSIEWVLPAQDVRAAVLAQYAWASSSPATPAREANDIEPAEKARPSLPAGPQPSIAPSYAEWRGHSGVRVGVKAEYAFFVSSAREHDDPLRLQFANDLVHQIHVRVGMPDVRFFYDVREVAPGADWASELVKGLSESSAAVCLLTPRYFTSEFCGREYSALMSTRIPIFPVPWGPVQAVPEVVSRIQMFGSRQDPRLKTSGLRELMRLDRFRDSYRAYVEELATLISAVVEKGYSAERAPVPSDWRALPDVFDLETRGVGRRVQAVCLAPTASDVGNLERVAGSPTDSAYGATGWHWRPFGGRPIQTIAALAAGDEGFAIRMFPSTPAAVESIYRTSDARQGGLIIVDWALMALQGSILKLLQSQVSAFVRVVVIQTPWSASIQGPFEIGSSAPHPDQPLPIRPTLEESQLGSVLRAELLGLRGAAIRDATVALPRAPAPLFTMPKLS